MNRIQFPRNVLQAFVPISRFNQGEANKIFAEVRQSGDKIVMKNNVPACVLVDPQRYQDMLDIIEDYYLLREAQLRVAEDKPKYMVSQQDVMDELGISETDLHSVEVDIT
ncbi:MAG: type II toxin-antitoxin system Phd/YefM family antitoxin [Anaerovoracaceae bacterium]